MVRITAFYLILVCALVACGNSADPKTNPNANAPVVIVLSATPIPTVPATSTVVPTVTPTALPMVGPGIHLIVRDINDDNNLAESLVAAVPATWLAPDG